MVWWLSFKKSYKDEHYVTEENESELVEQFESVKDWIFVGLRVMDVNKVARLNGKKDDDFLEIESSLEA